MWLKSSPGINFKKVCCKSFHFSPFVNCENACVQVTFTAGGFCSNNPTNMSGVSIINITLNNEKPFVHDEFGSRFQASQNPPNDALACSDLGSRKSFGSTKYPQREVES